MLFGMTFGIPQSWQDLAVLASGVFGTMMLLGGTVWLAAHLVADHCRRNPHSVYRRSPVRRYAIIILELIPSVYIMLFTWAIAELLFFYLLGKLYKLSVELGGS